MTDSNAYWQMAVDALRDQGFRFRIKWSGDDEESAWQPWVICPVPGYIESGSLGPVPVREVEWLEVSRQDRHGADKSDSIEAALNGAGIAFSHHSDGVRVVNVE